MIDFKNRKYHKLNIFAKSSETKIWVSEGGNLVQCETGVMRTSLIPGKYFVQFGLDNQEIPFDLDQDLMLYEE